MTINQLHTLPAQRSWCVTCFFPVVLMIWIKSPIFFIQSQIFGVKSYRLEAKYNKLKMLLFMSAQVNYVSAHDNETLFDVVMLKVCFWNHLSSSLRWR